MKKEKKIIVAVPFSLMLGSICFWVYHIIVKSMNLSILAYSYYYYYWLNLLCCYYILSIFLNIYALINEQDRWIWHGH